MHAHVYPMRCSRCYITSVQGPSSTCEVAIRSAHQLTSSLPLWSALGLTVSPGGCTVITQNTCKEGSANCHQHNSLLKEEELIMQAFCLEESFDPETLPIITGH